MDLYIKSRSISSNGCKAQRKPTNPSSKRSKRRGFNGGESFCRALEIVMVYYDTPLGAHKWSTNCSTCGPEQERAYEDGFVLLIRYRMRDDGILEHFLEHIKQVSTDVRSDYFGAVRFEVNLWHICIHEVCLHSDLLNGILQHRPDINAANDTRFSFDHCNVLRYQCADGDARHEKAVHP